jgi:hypothetical protein
MYESPADSTVNGCGRTLAMTTKTVRFASDKDFRVGVDIRLSILWPARLRDGTTLNLWMFGRVERSTLGEVEVAISRHEFRTRRAAGSADGVAGGMVEAKGNQLKATGARI